jgi:hypothetical protein
MRNKTSPEIDFKIKKRAWPHQSEAVYGENSRLNRVLAQQPAIDEMTDMLTD